MIPTLRDARPLGQRGPLNSFSPAFAAELPTHGRVPLATRKRGSVEIFCHVTGAR